MPLTLADELALPIEDLSGNQVSYSEAIEGEAERVRRQTLLANSDKKPKRAKLSDVLTHWHHTRIVPMKIGNKEFKIYAAPIESDYMIVGWDVLRRFPFVIDGPHNVLRIPASCSRK